MVLQRADNATRYKSSIAEAHQMVLKVTLERSKAQDVYMNNINNESPINSIYDHIFHILIHSGQILFLIEYIGHITPTRPLRAGGVTSFDADVASTLRIRHIYVKRFLQAKYKRV